MNELIHEHCVLVRHWARLQEIVTEIVRENSHSIAALEAEVVRLRGELLVARTQLYWGISGGALAAQSRTIPAPVPQLAGASRWREVDAVLCRTACTGHAHPWLDEQGHCTRSGERCEPPVEP